VPGPLSLFALPPDSWFWRVDGLIAAAAALLFLPAGIYLLLSGLDDLAMDLLWVLRSVLPGRRPPALPATQKRIAIWLPLWQEAGVVGRMLEHNLAAIDYGCYEIFAGVYSNDAETRREVESVAHRFARVHVATVPHAGPTSKADCLNWIYRGMLDWEQNTGRRVEVVVVHDAEDLIHPQALQTLQRYSEQAAMVQAPVLPLPTPWREFTHGLYCDDFAESQGKDLETRVSLGGFLPGCGVGTAIRRDALDALARGPSGDIMNPACLTEDYDIGLRLFGLGFRQRFVPLRWSGGNPVATREYFPRQASAAVRQRTRWVTGNALQAWERHGWGARLRLPLVQAWFFWRDRKGLWGNPVSLLCNALLVWGCLSWMVSLTSGHAWALAQRLRPVPGLNLILTINALLFAERLVVRAAASARVYGWRFASGVPLRLLWGNWINARASLGALACWAEAKIRRRPLGWNKTAHAYPAPDALRSHKRSLAEIVVGNGWCTAEAVSRVAQTLSPEESLGARLLQCGYLSEDELYSALSLSEGLPLAELDSHPVNPRVARALPEEITRLWNVLPLRVREGALEVACPEVPRQEALREIRRFTRLDVRLYLIRPSLCASLRAAKCAAEGERHLSAAASGG
jgi:adsorption protein B